MSLLCNLFISVETLLDPTDLLVVINLLVFAVATYFNYAVFVHEERQKLYAILHDKVLKNSFAQKTNLIGQFKILCDITNTIS